jgi:hypothetical protein
VPEPLQALIALGARPGYLADVTAARLMAQSIGGREGVASGDLDAAWKRSRVTNHPQRC